MNQSIFKKPTDSILINGTLSSVQTCLGSSMGGIGVIYRAMECVSPEHQSHGHFSGCRTDDLSTLAIMSDDAVRGILDGIGAVSKLLTAVLPSEISHDATITDAAWLLAGLTELGHDMLWANTCINELQTERLKALKAHGVGS